VVFALWSQKTGLFFSSKRFQAAKVMPTRAFLERKEGSKSCR
jgi:hypothetical protein